MNQDKNLTCRDCGAGFVFTASEQDFFAEKGFTNEPGRCPECRAARKQQNNNHGVIGVHGISLGATTAAMHAVLNESSKRVQFYIADSAYSDLAKLLEQQLAKHTRSSNLLWIDILIHYASLIAYIQSDFAYAAIRPAAAMGTVTTPILYLHGEADTLVPVEMSRELAAATNDTNGYRELHTFPGIKHGRAVLDSKPEYQAAVTNFLSVIGH